MTNEELAELIQRTDSKSTKAILWEHNKGMIYRLARSYYRPNMPYTLEDLVQYGYFALLKAVKSYKREKGYKFTSYLKYSFQCVMRDVDTSSYISLDVAISNDNDGEKERTIADTIPDNSALDELEHAINITADRQAIYNALERLPQRHMEIILAYYFKGHTLKQIASSMGVTYQRVNVLQREALSKLRKDPELIEVYQDTIQNRQLKNLMKSAERPENIESRQALAMMEHRQRRNERETDFINTLEALIGTIPEDSPKRIEYMAYLEQYKRSLLVLKG